MSEHTALPPTPAAHLVAERLQALAAQDAALHAPLDWHFATVLAQRTQAACGAVQAKLAQRLDQALSALDARLAAPSPAAAANEAPQPSPLTGLLSDMGAALLTPAPAASPSGRAPRTATAAPRNAPSARPELKSVGRMRKTLSRLKVRQQVSQALAQPPQHAGPINSQMLVLRSLALMQEISPEYLHRFMSHVDALMTLEDAQRLPTPGQALPKTGKAKANGKSGKR